MAHTTGATRVLSLETPEQICRYRIGSPGNTTLARILADTPRCAVVDARALRAHPGLRDGIGRAPLRLAGGETVKTTAHLEECWKWLADGGLSRDGILVGIGGGAVLDLAGLAAGTWQRGVRFVSVPTTLLAMVDAAIGGKTAINTAGLKNPVGLFHCASDVIADPTILASLPRREWRNGLAELLKTAWIGSPALWERLWRRRQGLAALFARGRADRRIAGVMDKLPWTKWIGAAARVKIDLVARDFREAGPRQALNLGHTFGHALEAYHRCGHGEAVAAGMAAVARCAVRRDLLDPAEGRRIMILLRACGLPTTQPTPPAARLRRLLLGDKKRGRRGLAWVLPIAPGRVLLDQRVTPTEIAVDARPRPDLD